MSEPTTKTKHLVDHRDHQKCVRCGHYLPGQPGSRHHRKMRSQSSKAEMHRVSNLVDVCGTGSTGCHGWIHEHQRVAYELGYLVHSYEDPAEVPLRSHEHGWVLLDDVGGLREVSHE